MITPYAYYKHPIAEFSQKNSTLLRGDDGVGTVSPSWGGGRVGGVGITHNSSLYGEVIPS